MSDYIFLFDLDSTITKEEILPTISKKIGKLEKMRELTEATMKGEIPFKSSFLNRVDILKNIKVSQVNEIVKDIPLNDAIANFIKNNVERCYIVTGNLDVWINELMKKLGMEGHVYCSRANVCDDLLTQVVSIADKELIVKQFVRPIVTIGDGDNDAGMAKMADIAIGFGGVRNIAPALMQNIDYAFYDEKTCADFLEKLL
ncbi:Phosphoserine phosphatase [uncultured Clostridium sp.]|nr:Phosphoserine phosphatase [uncultured Clostridium sp.]